jgi:glycosyltransferase involved in cell wall biosynthesis
MLNYLVNSLTRLKPDVVLAETSPVGWIAVEAAKKLSIPCLIDAHGLSFAETKGSGIEGWSEIALLEKASFESCDHLFVVSERMKNYVSSNFCIPKGKVTVASNGGSIGNLHARYGVPMNVVYAGIFAYWEKVGDLLDVAKEANPQKFRFYLAGGGTLKGQLLGRVRAESVPIKYLGYIPKLKMQELLVGMQVGIAPSTKDLARQVASPIKVFDYLSCGLPVITPKIGDWGDLVEAEDCGIALKDDTAEGYLSALAELYSPVTWEEKSKNALVAIRDKYNWGKTLEPISSVVSQF